MIKCCLGGVILLIALEIWLLILTIGFILFGIMYKLGVVKRFISPKVSVRKENLLELEEEDLHLLNSDNPKISFKYENINGNEYVPHLFICGRGSWRATQGNIFTSNMLVKEMQDEFNQRL